MPSYARDAIRELKKENRELRHGLDQVATQLQERCGRADLAQKSAADAWAFARVVLRTGRIASYRAPRGARHY